MYNKSWSFGWRMRRAALSTSAVIYIAAVFDVTGKHIPHWNLLGFALTCVYVSLAVRWAEARALPPSPYAPVQYPPSPYAGQPGAYPQAPYPPPPPPAPPMV